MKLLKRLFRKEPKSCETNPLQLEQRENWLTEVIVPRPTYKSIKIPIFSAIDYQERIGLQFLKNKLKESRKNLLCTKTNEVLIHDQKQLQLFQSFLSQKIRSHRKADVHVDKLFVKAVRMYIKLIKSSQIELNSDISITERQLQIFFLSTMEFVTQGKELSFEDLEKYTHQFTVLLNKFQIALTRVHSYEDESESTATRERFGTV